MSESRVTREEVDEQWSSYEEITSEPESIEGVPDDSEVFWVWNEMTPEGNFGPLSVRTPVEAFEKGFYAALAEGMVDRYIETCVKDEPEKPYEGVYVLLTDEQDLSGSTLKKKHNHGEGVLGDIEQKLTAFEKVVEESEMPEVYKKEYRRKIELRERFLASVGMLATPQLTQEYMPGGEWAKMVDAEQSEARGELVFPYEKVAREMLEQGPVEQGRIPRLHDRLAMYGLSGEEMNYLAVSEESWRREVMTSQETARLYEVLLHRSGLIEDGWRVKVEVDRTTTAVSAKELLIKLPVDWEFDEHKGFVPWHELIHVVRAANGDKQPCSQLKRGMEDYRETEEGVATIAEMVLGAPFGHDRQREYAARYLAVAMMAKARITNTGEVEPVHSVQEVYDTLVGYDINPDEAGKIIWRVIRGTSLQHKGLMLTVGEGEEQVQVPAAEVYAKDTVYFRGLMTIHTWMREMIPVYEGVQRKLTTETTDFSERTLARIGWARVLRGVELEAGEITTQADLRKAYKELTDLGRNTLVSLVNYLCPGKTSLEAMIDKQSEWRSYIRRGGDLGLIDYGKVVEPRTDLSTLWELREAVGSEFG